MGMPGRDFAILAAQICRAEHGGALWQSTTRSFPSNAGWQRDLAISYDNVGDVQVAQSDLAGALKSYRASLAIRERLASLDYSNAQWQNDLDFVIGRIGGLGYYGLLARDFATALAAADQAISLAPEKIWLYTNRAHALMFLDRIDEARALYLKYRGQKNVQNGKSWEAVVLEDFAELRKAGSFAAVGNARFWHALSPSPQVRITPKAQNHAFPAR